ncbi:MAG: hypothetical protein RR367_02280 [Clostridia bacterium]
MQAQAIQSPARRRVRVRFSNHVKCLFCYLICFAVPVLWQAMGLWLCYPYQLAGTAPNVARHLLDALPLLSGTLSGMANAAADPAAADPALWRAALAVRDGAWRAFLVGCYVPAWALTLLTQLLWRFAHGRAVFTARNTARAVHAYRLLQLGIWAINALFASTVWLAGVRFIPQRTAWDFLVYFVAYALNALAALCCFRLAAPPALSGRHAFFKRL